jgi:hypothetical protein
MGAEIDIPPGVVKTLSGATARGRYVDAQWVRFVGGRPEKMRGYDLKFNTSFTGVPRAMHAWRAPSGLELVAVGTEQKLFACGGEGETADRDDITPYRYRAVTLGANPFATTNGSAVVTVTDTAHGQATGDPVVFSGAAAVAGITILGRYDITVVNANSYTITHSATANAATSGGGSSVSASYEKQTLGNNPFSMTNASAVVTVTDTAHGATNGATVVFSGAAAGGGITISGPYVLTYVDANSYTITHTAAATSTTTGGGATVVAAYQINIGTVDGYSARGYGVGPYGEEAYGTARTLSLISMDPRFWALDNYGDWLLAAHIGSTIYLYDEDNDDRAQPLENAPTDVRFAFVTEERYIFALCEAMVLRWPDRDDITDWTAGSTDTANTRTLASGNKLVAGSVLGGGVSLIWTDTSLYLAQ